MGFGGNNDARRANNGAKRNARLMRQMFLTLGEPYMTPLVAALANRAGLSPYSLFGNDNTANGLQGQAQALQAPVVDEQPPAPPQNDAIRVALQNAMGTRTQNSAAPGARSPLQTPAGQVAVGAPGAGVGQAAPGVQNGSANPLQALAGTLGRTATSGPAAAAAPAVMQTQPVNGTPSGNPKQPLGSRIVNPLPASNPAQNGWSEQESIQWNQGRDQIAKQFGNIQDRALAAQAGRTGTGNNSIQAGLAAKLAAEEMRQTGALNQQIRQAGFARQDQALQQLASILGGFMGMPVQAGQLQLGVAQNALAQQAAQQQQLAQLAGLGAFFV